MMVHSDDGVVTGSGASLPESPSEGRTDGSDDKRLDRFETCCRAAYLLGRIERLCDETEAFGRELDRINR